MKVRVLLIFLLASEITHFACGSSTKTPYWKPATLGVIAEPGNFPYHVSLQRHSDLKHFCSGAIVNGLWIVTAGDCVGERSPAEMYALVGSLSINFGSIYELDLAVLHPNYTPMNASNNLALLRSSEPIVLGTFVAYIDVFDYLTTDDMQILLTGWGSHNRPDLRNFEMLHWTYYKILPNYDCRRRLPKEDPDAKIYSNSLCALTTTDRSTCVGDTGSPLAYEGRLVGVKVGSYGCGNQYPDVFITLFQFRSWIRNMLKAKFEKSSDETCVCRGSFKPSCTCKNIIPINFVTSNIN